MKAALAVWLSLAVAAPLAADEKLKKPALNLRATPRFAFSPATVRVTAELVGGGNAEEFYCPEIEWEWDDGGKSVQEGDCEPFEEDKTTIGRRFSASHDYRQAGSYTIKATLKRSGKPIASQTVRVTVRPGAGDRSPDFN